MDKKLNPTHMRIIDEIFSTEVELAEGIMGDLKNTVVSKAKSWGQQIKKLSGDALPSLQAKYDQTMSKLKIKDADQANKVEVEMKKQGGSGWMANAGKLAAALAVASSLLAASASGAAAGERGHGGYGQQPHRQLYSQPMSRGYGYDQGRSHGYGQQRGYDGYGQQRGYDGYRHQHQHGYGQQDQTNVAVGVLVGVALGALIGAAAAGNQ
jgi:hypothetical protein